jgi:hypothetical protein
VAAVENAINKAEFMLDRCKPEEGGFPGLLVKKPQD